MPNYLSPGVYVEEVSSGIKPIAGVGTAVGAFIGYAEKGVLDQAVLVTNWSQFVAEFGGFIPNGYLAYAVYGFFAEGGTSCYVVRVAGNGSVKAATKIKDGELADLFEVTARSEGAWGNRISVTIADPSNAKTNNFKLIVKYKEAFKEEYEGEETEGEIVEVFDNLSITTLESKVNDVSAFVDVKVSIDLTLEANQGKRPGNTAEAQALTLGNDGTTGADFIGDSLYQTGLYAFDVVDDMNIVAAPDKAGDRTFILAALNYCKERKDCFFIADPPHGLTPTEVKNFKDGTSTPYLGNAFNSSYGALYYPWVFVNDPLTSKKKLVPPSGCVAGTYAYVDSTRGVHKAPAGIVDGYLDTVLGVERIVTKGEQELLNPDNINVIRSLPEGICIWGARTLSADPEWVYINVRRLMMFIEESVNKASQWVVFEPNDASLWGKVKRNLGAFLARVWRDGALFGTVQEEAFFVKVDEENNPPAVRDAGQLIIEVGVAPVKPAEFIVIRVSQKTLSK